MSTLALFYRPRLQQHHTPWREAMASSSPCLERLETLYIAAAIAKAKLCCPGPPWWVSSFYLCKQSLGRCEIRWNPTFHGWTVALNWTCPSSPNHKAISEYLGITRPLLCKLVTMLFLAHEITGSIWLGMGSPAASITQASRKWNIVNQNQ